MDDAFAVGLIEMPGHLRSERGASYVNGICIEIEMTEF